MRKKAKTQELCGDLRRQLPQGLHKIESDIIIRKGESFVNTKNNGINKDKEKKALFAKDGEVKASAVKGDRVPRGSPQRAEKGRRQKKNGNLIFSVPACRQPSRNEFEGLSLFYYLA